MWGLLIRSCHHAWLRLFVEVLCFVIVEVKEKV
jgi:hypothetical protein